MTKADEEKAREIVRAAREVFKSPNSGESFALSIAPVITAAHAEGKSEGRAEAYADAARVARDRARMWKDQIDPDSDDCAMSLMDECDDIAAAIEAKAKECTPKMTKIPNLDERITRFKPISTAPQDGTDVILLPLNATKPLPWVCHFYDGMWVASPRFIRERLEAKGLDWRAILGTIWSPTHWAPLL